MPGISVDFDWDDDELQRKLDTLIAEWPRHRAAVRRAIMEDVAGGLRREIPTSSGAAKQTIRLRDIDSQRPAKVVAGGKRGVDYIRPLLEGSRPHPPGSWTPEENPRLARWAARNGMDFDRVYWHIAEHGTEAHDFVSGPVAETQARAADIGATVLRQRGVFDR
ncbi:hypothetical protein [Halomarina rubra]|uniref:HK97 gp10 family phage protein n=1 Tax=Halomarina rubra TaxID=2071873 RepID=A0ABD6B0J2_9EURY|nr:hypothetical protein [Halomarina rubra]